MSTPFDPFEEELARAARLLRPSTASGCLAPEVLASFHAGAVGEEECEVVREPLAACPACAGTAADARRFLAEMAGQVDRPARDRRASSRHRARPVRWALAAAAMLTAAAVGLMFWIIAGPRAGNPSARWQDVAIEMAPYPLKDHHDDLVWRGPVPHDDPAGAFETHAPINPVGMAQWTWII